MNNNINKRLGDIETATSNLLPRPQFVLEWARNFPQFMASVDSSKLEVVAEKVIKKKELSTDDLATIDQFNESYIDFMNYSDLEGKIKSIHWLDGDSRILPEAPAFDQFVDKYREEHYPKIKISFTHRWKAYLATHPLGGLKDFRAPVEETREKQLVDFRKYPIFIACE
jgi:hypothetical protein